MLTHTRYSYPLWLSLACASAAACSDDSATGTGTLNVLLEAEDVIREGLAAGDGLEDIRDGWTVTFDKYLVTLGHIDAHQSSDQSKVADDEALYTVDLKRIPQSGLELWKLEDLKAGRWDFFFEQMGSADGAERHTNVEQADFDEMVDNDYSHLISGSSKNPEGQACPPAKLAKPGDKKSNGKSSGGNACYDQSEVRFTLGVQAETVFGPCETEGVPGFSVADGGKQTISITIHGDHLFFNGFGEGGEGGVTRLAQWLADCDLNLDGSVTKEELEQVSPSDLPAIDDRYQLGGSPITPLDTMYDYVRSQLKTQGHVNGEGECPIDGEEHDHGEHNH
jgi:hypothetical protein